MTDASTFGNFAKIDFGRRKALPNVLHGIHADTIGQNLALRKWQDLPADERQHLDQPAEAGFFLLSTLPFVASWQDFA